jgi:ArsR family transcriptional regulator
MSAVCDDANSNKVVRILKAVAHPVRLKIVALLCGEDLHVSAMSEALGINQAIISQQLRILRMSGLVEATREAGFAVYHLTEPHLRDLVACMEKCCSDQENPQ